MNVTNRKQKCGSARCTLREAFYSENSSQKAFADFTNEIREFAKLPRTAQSRYIVDASSHTPKRNKADEGDAQNVKGSTRFLLNS